MKNYLLDRSRKFFKSIGKIEYKIKDKITFNISKNKNKNILKDKDFKNFLLSQNKPNKMAIVICFYFTKKRLEPIKGNHYIIQGDMKSIDLNKKYKFIFIGFSAWLLLIPLAATSSQKMINLLKQNWKKLHRIVYIIAIFGALHYIWLSKTIFFKPLIYSVIIVVLLILRIRIKTGKFNYE